MEKTVTQAFAHETIILDGMNFLDCEFRSCILVYRGGPLPTFDGSFIDQCEWRFEGAALRTIGLLQRMSASGGENLIKSLFPTLN